MILSRWDIINIAPVLWCLLNSFIFGKPYTSDMGGPSGPPMPFRSFNVYLPKQRYRKVTVSARRQSLSGLKVVAEVPSVMPFSAAHSTASV